MALNTDPLQTIKTPAPIVQAAMDPTATQTVTQPAPTTEAAPVTSPVEPYKAPETKPVLSQVGSEQETVEDRLNTLTAKGSKYTELAKKDAMREANTRGLINSTMAAGAGTEAAIRSALPIAQQDAKTVTDTRMANQVAENAFLKNRQSADLNIEVAAMDSQFKTKFETIMQDNRFSDETKGKFVAVMGDIIRDTQQQIATIGTTDRSAAQQASAIKMLEQSRDAQLAVYEDLLGTFNDWDWGLDFIPKTNAAEIAAETPETPEPEPLDVMGIAKQALPSSPLLGVLDLI